MEEPFVNFASSVLCIPSTEEIHEGVMGCTFALVIQKFCVIVISKIM